MFFFFSVNTSALTCELKLSSRGQEKNKNSLDTIFKHSLIFTKIWMILHLQEKHFLDLEKKSTLKIVYASSEIFSKEMEWQKIFLSRDQNKDAFQQMEMFWLRSYVI